MKSIPTPTRTLLARSLLLLATATAFGVATPAAQAGVFVSVNIAPPVLPVYVQPPIPAAGYIWTPGYWAYNEDGGYYWVPGTWVQPPYFGALWTPAYWGWEGGAYVFHTGYWGRHVGYYGGINYGFGYVGVGYEGGYWGPHGFFYNRTVNRITNVNITNVYNKTVINNAVVNRTSFNGPGGVTSRPTAQEAAFTREAHTPAVAAQVQHQTLAAHDQSLRATVNHGMPAVAATPRPGAFAATAASPAHGTALATNRAQPTAQRASLASSHYAPNAGVPAERGPALNHPQAQAANARHTQMNRPVAAHAAPAPGRGPQLASAAANGRPARVERTAPSRARASGESEHRH